MERMEYEKVVDVIVVLAPDSCLHEPGEPEVIGSFCQALPEISYRGYVEGLSEFC